MTSDCLHDSGGHWGAHGLWECDTCGDPITHTPVEAARAAIRQAKENRT